jgi:hypothetical protein
MANEVSIKCPQEVEIGQYGEVEFSVKLDGKAHGRLRITRTGIWWAQGGRRAAYRRSLSWTRLRAIMEEHGKKAARP